MRDYKKLYELQKKLTTSEIGRVTAMLENRYTWIDGTVDHKRYVARSKRIKEQIKEELSK